MSSTVTNQPQGGAGHLSAADSVMWDIEEDPVLRSTITALAVLDRPPEWNRLVRRIDYATRVFPRLRQRVVESPLHLGRPRWVVDPAFDLSYHLRRVRAPAGGSLRDVLDVIEPLAGQPFDRARPLWEFTLVEGMEGGGAALVQKIHHTITDGVGGIELALAILDDRPDAPEPDPPPAPAPGRIDALTDLRATWDIEFRSVLDAGMALPGAAVRQLVATTRHPIGMLRRVRGLATSVARVMAPVPQSSSPILTGRGLRRRFVTLELPLVDLKRAARPVGGTANDALLASVVEGVRRYHALHGIDLTELRLTMPVNLRHEGQGLGGNHFAPLRFAVRASIDDPNERMRHLDAVTRRWRAEPALGLTDLIAGGLSLLPADITTAVFGAMLKHVDAVVTNVPGIRSRSFLAGAEILREYALAPPVGAALNVALVSHLDTACVGVVIDSAAVPDDEALVACLIEGFDEVAGHRVTLTS